MLSVYNTLTQQKEIFKPIHPGKIGIYVCGMTVYDYCHIGHARVWVVFDMLVRYLRSRDYEVNYVRNVTDIDDKIIKRARENNESYTDLTERMIQSMHEDEIALHVLPPTQEPRATHYIAQMIALIQKLIAHDCAYIASNGDVYFEVAKFKTYGKLAHQDLEKLRSGARVAIEMSKNDPLDFVLWKLAKPDEPSWDSPWGAGRPGWHIECSAMSMECLAEQFDIHGGGLDLTFPHHQNEIAQSEGATGKRWVNTWMHVGFVQIDKEKMSKSLGNFFTVREVLKVYSPEIIRYFLLASHYRSPVNYSTLNLESAQQALERFYLSLRGLPLNENRTWAPSEFTNRFNETMDDDFNTPEALAVLFDLAREINRLRENNLSAAVTLGYELKHLGNILGLLQQNPDNFLQGYVPEKDAEKIEALIQDRNAARKNKNWAESDRIRDELLKDGISLEDSATGTTWRRG